MFVYCCIYIYIHIYKIHMNSIWLWLNIFGPKNIAIFEGLIARHLATATWTELVSRVATQFDESTRVFTWLTLVAFTKNCSYPFVSFLTPIPARFSCELCTKHIWTSESILDFTVIPSFYLLIVWRHFSWLRLCYIFSPVGETARLPEPLLVVHWSTGSMHRWWKQVNGTSSSSSSFSIFGMNLLMLSDMVNPLFDVSQILEILGEWEFHE